MSIHQPSSIRVSRAVRGALVAALIPTIVVAQEGGGPVEEVVVTSFRESLEQSLDAKRNTASAVDAIFAEDIADFPDTNLAESVQRIPGVAIDRVGGEGKQISIRGLSPEFSRVRINGMEALTTTSASDAVGTNRGRAFDFNVFASELFNQIQVRKTSAAEVDEGSLGATIELRTARPLDFDGTKFVTSYQQGYNDLSDEMDPRAVALFRGERCAARSVIAHQHRGMHVRQTARDGFSGVRHVTRAGSIVTRRYAGRLLRG